MRNVILFSSSDWHLLHRELVSNLVRSCADPRYVPRRILAATLPERGSLRQPVFLSVFACCWLCSSHQLCAPLFPPAATSLTSTFLSTCSSSFHNCFARQLWQLSVASLATRRCFHELFLESPDELCARPRADPRVLLRTLIHVLRVVWWSPAPPFSPPRAARGGRWLQRSTALAIHLRSALAEGLSVDAIVRCVRFVRLPSVHPAESFGVVLTRESAVVTRSRSCPGHFSTQTCLCWLTTPHVWWSLCVCLPAPSRSGAASSRSRMPIARPCRRSCRSSCSHRAAVPSHHRECVEHPSRKAHRCTPALLNWPSSRAARAFLLDVVIPTRFCPRLACEIIRFMPSRSGPCLRAVNGELVERGTSSLYNSRMFSSRQLDLVTNCFLNSSRRTVVSAT